ncbi:FecR domain-containing protein [Metapseudomonas otitidis]|uniref:FecR domain-containing protein n=1 Tax=Metapseudomonas otitidis TaxID=319939 RepID=UPI00244989CA|nr:FecR domain-containing protein [Pseudomonas otitidis]MDG9783590.1 FecR domain-containing protein [Pseudomonas otitidis]
MSALDLKTLEAAAQWYVTLAEEGEAAREAHVRWLASDPRHALAWARVERLQAKLGRVTADIARPTLKSARIKRRAVLKVFSILVAAGGTAALGVQYRPLRSTWADYRTAAGETLELDLPEGTQLTLNTRTSVNVNYGPVLRQVDLLEGEIRVQTAADDLARPFVVHTPCGSVHALGTRFLVRSEASGVRAGVMQHAVEVRPQQAPMQVVRLEAGQQLTFTRTSVGTPAPLPKGADAWTHGQLLVNDWRLDDFVAELARYHPGYLGCAPEAGALRISGAFQLQALDTVLDNLSGTLPVRVRRLTRWWARVERS